MSKEQKRDFRLKLNKLLHIFYQTHGAVDMDKLMEREIEGLTSYELNTAYQTLVKEGHITKEFVTFDLDFNEIEVGSITGKGRIFYEQGGYKDNTTYLDKLTTKAKNNKALAWVIFLFIGATSLFGTVKLVIDLIEAFSK